MSEEWDHGSLVADAVLAGPINQDLLDKHWCSRRTIKVVCFGVSASAKVPYIPIALTLPGGAFLAFANCAAFLGLEYWAIEGTIDDFLGPRSTHEVVMLQKGPKGKCYRVATLSTAVVLSLISQIPVAFPALDYDGAYAKLGFGVLLVAGSLLPIRSIQLSVDRSLQLQCLRGEIGKKIEVVRADMVSFIDDHGELFTTMDFLQQIQLLTKMSEIRTGDVVDKVNAYTKLVLARTHMQPAAQKSSLCDRVSYVTGLLITSTFQVALTMYTWSKTKEHIADDNATAASFAGLVLCSGIYLTGKSIIQTTQRMTRSIVDFFRCRQQRTIAEQVNPALCFSLKTIGMVINLAALGPTVRIWGDFYKDNPAQTYMEVTMCAAIFLFLSTATLALAEKVVRDIVCSGNHRGKKEIVQYHQELGQFAKILQESPLVDFSIFVMKCPEDVKGELLERVELAEEALRNYINQNNLLQLELSEV